MISALDYPQQVGEPPVVTLPDVIPGGQVHIPDSNLRAAIAEELGKSVNAPITAEDMKRLTQLNVDGKDIRDLTGLQFATKLSFITGSGSKVSDLSPIAGLTQLKALDIDFIDSPSVIHDAKQLSRLVNLTFLALHGVEDLTPLAGLPKLEKLFVSHSNIRDLSPLARLVNLELIHMGTSASDLSPLAGLTKLRHLYLPGGDISGLTPLAGLTNLEELYLFGNDVADISPLAGLTDLKRLDLSRNDISDISPLAGLSNLKWLNLVSNNISNLSPLARLTNLKWLNLARNDISNLSPLARLTNLTWLGIHYNKITDFTPLDGLHQIKELLLYYNPGFPIGGPKIEGPWLWAFLPDTRLRLDDTDLLAEASGGSVTELKIATQGATEGKAVGDDVWTSDKLPPTGRDNLDDMVGRALPDGVMYGTVFLYSPREQNTTMYLGCEQEVKVWLNGVLIYKRNPVGDGGEYTDFFPVTLRQGKNVLLVAGGTQSDGHSNAFFGFEPGTEYFVGTAVDYAFSKASIHLGDTFTLDIRAENVSDLAGWQFDIAFDPSILEAVEVSEGDFLKTDGGATFFQSGRIDNAAGKITGLIAGRISEGGVSGSGSVLQVRFKAKSEGESELALGNFLFGSNTEESIPAGPLEIRITVEERLLTGDVNRDGLVNILDLIRVARQLGQRVSADSAVDINGDGVVNIFDLTLVAQGIGGAAAPPARGIDSAKIETWIAQARLVDDGSIAFRQGIANLEVLLASMIPQETALLPNYPNPFNPETWIPYQLAAPAEVTLTIYDMNGHAVRRLAVGHQAAGMYQSRERAAYWDGCNQCGESISSGLYFYTLEAGEFTATRKMLIRK